MVAERCTRIEASWGLGASIVGGTVTPDTYEAAPDGGIRRTIAHKTTRLDRTHDSTGLPGPAAVYCDFEDIRRYEAAVKLAREAGYDGVEVWVPGDEKGKAGLLEAMQKHGLEFGLLCGGSDPNFDKHLPQFEAQLRNALVMKPIYVNCHSGRDYFTLEQAKQFFALTAKMNRESGVPIYHETHRGRLCFAAHITRRFLEEVPDLRLTLDISHWCNVHESLLGDQPEAVALALSRTDHIHTRVGHPEGRVVRRIPRSGATESSPPADNV